MKASLVFYTIEPARQSRETWYVCTFKAVEAVGTCMYLGLCTYYFKAVEAGTCRYLGLFRYMHVPRGTSCVLTKETL